MNINGAVVLVTGASSGIGTATLLPDGRTPLHRQSTCTNSEGPT